ncbi:unnamed protein product [Caenorhabditis angaria]|uniref:BTB domain-containing protein n=1 Tax=Caenorhabditis angaria TaxID=860376 RepID=A0A9P1IAN0_9PELO|nr:unnamed protein product [Caenorhabditis angaria]
MNNPIHCDNKTIKWRFENVKEWKGEKRYSEEFEIDSVKWKIGIELRNRSGKQDLYADFYCCSLENVKGSICAVKAEVILLRQIGENNHLSRFSENVKYFDSDDYRYSCDVPTYFWDNILLQQNRLVKNNSIIIEVNFDFIFYDFSRKVPNYSDLVVKVEDVELHFNKGSLCMLSDYFYNLLITNNSAQSSEIKIDDVKLLDFMKLMMFSHPNVPFWQAIEVIEFIKTDDCDKFLDLASRFKIKTIPMKIATLLETSNNSNSKCVIMKFIKFADKFNFPRLLQTCMQSFKSSKELKEATKTVEFEALSDVSKVQFLRRFLDFE